MTSSQYDLDIWIEFLKRTCISRGFVTGFFGNFGIIIEVTSRKGDVFVCCFGKPISNISLYVSPFQADISLLYSLNIIGNFMFFYIFGGYRTGILT